MMNDKKKGINRVPLTYAPIVGKKVNKYGVKVLLTNNITVI